MSNILENKKQHKKKIKMAKIKLPKRIFGIDTAEAFERVMKEAENPMTGQEQVQEKAPDLKGFVYVPSIKLYLAKERDLNGLNWNQAQEELRKRNLMMPTPYQFREFLKFLKTGYQDRQEAEKILDEILTVRNPWRAEWLNARFEKRKDGLYMISENILVNGKYQNIEQKLDNFLAEDKTPGISLDDWLNSNSQHGLPTAKVKKGELYYWYPRSGSVAGFGADSVWAYLGCYWGPEYSDSLLGVRACAKKIAGAK